jgi:glutamine cyclotransferase
MKKTFTSFLALLFLAACTNNVPTNSGNTGGGEPPIIGYTVVNIYPHDTSFYTEGLEFYEGQLFESSGGYKKSTPHPSAFGIADLKTGKVDKKAVLDNNIFFGEGITFFNNRIYELTWESKKGFIYDAKTFKKTGEFTYEGEGWALTHDSSHLIMSDGSSNLKYIDPDKITDRIVVDKILGVADNNGPVSNINELEYVNGYIFANQYTTNYILKIDPASGRVVGKLDLTGLENEAKKKNPGADVLNGIAYRTETNTFFITGKLWPSFYEIRMN